MLLALVTALGVGLWLSALNVQYRDVRYVVPFLIQFWLFATPIVYPSSLLPERWRTLYAINPMVGVVEGLPLGAARHGHGAGPDDRSSRPLAALVAADRRRVLLPPDGKDVRGRGMTATRLDGDPRASTCRKQFRAWRAAEQVSDAARVAGVGRGAHRAALRSRGGSDAGDDARTLWALRDVSFDVRTGEALGIIGATARARARCSRCSRRSPSRRPDASSSAAASARCSKSAPASIRSSPAARTSSSTAPSSACAAAEIARKFDEIVAFAEVEQFIDTPVKRYSSGMYLRLAFAVAAHLEPEILIVDEVLAVGDAAFQKKCLGKMSDVARHGRTSCSSATT